MHCTLVAALHHEMCPKCCIAATAPQLPHRGRRCAPHHRACPELCTAATVVHKMLHRPESECNSRPFGPELPMARTSCISGVGATAPSGAGYVKKFKLEPGRLVTCAARGYVKKFKLEPGRFVTCRRARIAGAGLPKTHLIVSGREVIGICFLEENKTSQ